MKFNKKETQTTVTQDDVDKAKSSVSMFTTITLVFLALSFAVPFFFTPIAIFFGFIAILSNMVRYSRESKVNKNESN